MKNKIITSLVFLSLFMTLLALPSVMSATVSIVSPTIQTNGTGTQLNATITPMGVIPYNCTFYASSISTANSTRALISTANMTNTSAISVETTFDFTATVFEDSNDYLFEIACTNGTYVTGSNTGITIDTTIPSAPTSSTPATGFIDTDGNVDFSATVIGANTTGCTLYFPSRNPGSSSYTMTHTGDTCTHSLTSVSEESYDWYITASDGTNSSSASSQSFRVDISTGGAKGGAIWLIEQGEAEAGKSGTLTIAPTTQIFGLPLWLIIVIVVVGIVVIVKIKKR